ncbi:MAG: MalY/PatB family protein [Cellulosilyticaceae bacterium]
MINFNEKPNRIDEKCRKWDRGIIESKFGKVQDDFIPMWIADMDFRIPEAVERRFKEAIERGVFGYTYCYDSFYKAVMSWQKDRHGVEVAKESIILTYGTVSTLHYTVQAFCTPGDSIIVNTPVYDPFEGSAKKQGVNVIKNTLKLVDNRYFIDFETLDAQMKEHKPKLMFFCTPHNPSGRIWSLEEIRQVAQLCKQNGVILVADEVHAEHIHYGKFESVLHLEEALVDNIILLTSPNKGFNLGGLKTSYAIIKNASIRKIFADKLVQNSITSPNVFGIIGLITAYDECRDWLDAVNAYIKGNYELVESFMAEHLPELKVMKMESSYLVWVDISVLKIDATAFTLGLAKEQSVLVEDGSHFVQDGSNYIRLNLGIQRDSIQEALVRIQKYITNMEA